jgi:uncharacterized protein
MDKIIDLKPEGWLKKDMLKEVQQNVIDKLPELVSTIFTDNIFSSDRIGLHTKPKDLGTLENDASWNAQFFWWNAETIGNYYDGLVGYGYLLDDANIALRTKTFFDHILNSQDSNGYIGIYIPEFRYQFDSENGELWAKTTIGRFILANYHYYEDQNALNSVISMTDELMKAWPKNQSEPFKGQATFAGVAHGLMFVDVLYELYEITKELKYIEYACFLYEDYNRHDVSEKDCLIVNILNSDYRFMGHGVHSYEQLRAIAIYDRFGKKQLNLVEKYLDKLQYVLSPSGGPIGDEWIMGNTAHAEQHGYEFCSIHELMVSLIFISKLGFGNYYDWVEKLYLNANRGAHLKQHCTIAYLKSDDSYAMEGSFQQEQKHSIHKIQTRYKYSPTHQDAAVCCVPNAVRITPYYLKGSLSLINKQVIINYLIPMSLYVRIDDQTYFLEVTQASPYQLAVVHTDLGDRLVLPYHLNDSIQVKRDFNHRVYFEFKNIVFAYPINSIVNPIKPHIYGLHDIYLRPIKKHIPMKYRGAQPKLIYNENNPEIHVELYQEGKCIQAILIPMGETDLRQVSFEDERE